ncbi:hypothetical protein F5Y03DRAFT_403527 [Xylaria venustula]|nr:hypothetical protein F5Y03DRAFT_403527 [Xylaria venustula]
MRFALLSLLVATFSAAAATVTIASYSSNEPGIPGYPTKTARPMPAQWVDIVIETFHKDTKTLTNKTITMAMNGAYQNSTNLMAVTTLYSLGYVGISCVPFLGSGLARSLQPYGMPFSAGHPSYLGHNDTVVVTRIICTDTGSNHGGNLIPTLARYP